MSTLPTIDGKGFDILDLGANTEKPAHHLHQYAVLGSFYAKNVRGIAQPRVGLLNNGTESSKGDPLRKETYELLAADESLNFIGNVEARDLMNGVADVVVADGFTGNAVLKSIEGTAMGIMGLLKTAITGGGLRAKLGALTSQGQPQRFEKTAQLLRCWWSSLVWCQGTGCQNSWLKRCQGCL